ncbi:cytosolic non-specific dipeptidase [Loa loa]|uniref:Cytosolic non-specific dipeptidase n=1 Tax=Loa loa TaxID=7209 RepID=A0A1S0TR74_LOALO|nr:cytosolic non-specific dipeptidase [Loa loa]EFO18441.1 cytosolic non-specific dipeptidase [Loa loa]
MRIKRSLSNDCKKPSQYQVSEQPQRRADVVRMVQWTKMQMEGLGSRVELCDSGKQTLSDAFRISLPPVLFGTLEPFNLVEKDGKLYGRGSTDNKGPVVAWINALDVLCKCELSMPGFVLLFRRDNQLQIDLHSGIFGGSVYKPMSDLVWMMSQLTDIEGCIMIGGIMNLLAPVQMKKLYETLVSM